MTVCYFLLLTLLQVSSALSCPSNCLNCEESNACTKCKDGFFLESSNTCLQCKEDKCIVCRDSGSHCMTCKDGYLAYAGSCRKIVEPKNNIGVFLIGSLVFFNSFIVLHCLYQRQRSQVSSQQAGRRGNSTQLPVSSQDSFSDSLPRIRPSSQQGSSSTGEEERETRRNFHRQPSVDLNPNLRRLSVIAKQKAQKILEAKNVNKFSSSNFQLSSVDSFNVLHKIPELQNQPPSPSPSPKLPVENKNSPSLTQEDQINHTSSSESGESSQHFEIKIKTFQKRRASSSIAGGCQENPGTAKKTRRLQKLFLDNFEDSSSTSQIRKSQQKRRIKSNIRSSTKQRIRTVSFADQRT